MSVDIILKDIEWDGINKLRVPLEGGGTQEFSIGGGVTPTGNINIAHSGQTDVTNYATATVPSADANAGAISPSYVTENNQRKWKFTYEGYAESPGWVDEGAFGSPLTYEYNAIPSNTTITPTTSAQTIGGANTMMEGAVTVSAVPSMTLPATTSSTPTGTRRANLFPSTSQQYLNIPAGLNDTAKYYQIIGMDLAPLNVTQNGTYNASDVDITGFNTVTVNVPSGSSTCETKTMANSDSQATSIQFTGLSGEPKWFFVRCTSQLTRSSSYSYYFVTDIRYNGTNHNGNYYRRSNGTYYNDTSHYSHTYSNGTLTVSSSANRGSAGGSFYNGNYELVYIY